MTLRGGGSWSSPRAWGCFWAMKRACSTSSVFPTCVGVFLKTVEEKEQAVGLPHVRGGVSCLHVVVYFFYQSSPRAWGCFPLVSGIIHFIAVFPTCVGVFLALITSRALEASLPHVRGGVSLTDRTGVWGSASSPRAWGCFFSHIFVHSRHKVFPTCVGVFPHMPPVVCSQVRSSPRAWGCFCDFPHVQR